MTEKSFRHPMPLHLWHPSSSRRGSPSRRATMSEESDAARGSRASRPNALESPLAARATSKRLLPSRAPDEGLRAWIRPRSSPSRRSPLTGSSALPRSLEPPAERSGCAARRGLDPALRLPPAHRCQAGRRGDRGQHAGCMQRKRGEGCAALDEGSGQRLDHC